MRRRESVIDKDVAERRELFGEVLVVLFLAGMEAGIFQTKNVAVLHRGDRGLGFGADAILGEGDGTLDDARHFGGDRPQRILRVRSLGAAQMREQDHLAALVGQLEDGRRDFLDAGRVRDPAVLHRDVQVDAEQDAFAFDVGVIETAKGGLHQYADAGTHNAHDYPGLLT